MKTGKDEGTSPTRYELRGLRLFVNGEAQAVGRQTVMVAIARCWRVTGYAVSWTGGVAEIPRDLALLILNLESKVATEMLAAELAGMTAA